MKEPRRTSDVSTVRPSRIGIGAGVCALSLAIGSGLACAPQRDCTARIYHKPHREVSSVVARGDFNGWGETAMEEICPCVWYAGLDLEPGDYRYVLEVDGIEELDILAPLEGWDDDGETPTSLLRVEDCAVPSFEVVHAEASAEGELRVELLFLRASSGANLDPGRVVAELPDGTPVNVIAQPRDGTLTVTATTLPPGKHTLRIEAGDRDGVATEPLFLPLWVEDQPFRWADALLYQVVVDRFADEGGSVVDPDAPADAIGLRHGGDLFGLIAALEDGYFDALGVNALWISPMVLNPDGTWPGADGREYEGYHGYWPIAPREVDPRFGGEAALDELVTAAHERGVRVLMDVVPNHVHTEHPYWTERAADDEYNGDGSCVCGSPDCPWDEFIDSCWFTPYLADLDLRRNDVLQRQVDDVAWWVERFDLDGVRVDAVPMMPRSATRALVHELRRRFEAGPTELYIVGETFTGSSGWTSIQRYLGPYGLDGQFDFPVMWSLRETLAHGNGSLVDLTNSIGESQHAWSGPDALMAPFVGNHDVTRFLSEAAGDTGHAWEDPPPPPADDEPYRRLVLAQSVALTLPGVPTIYYGDEIGLPGAGDPDNRRPMRFGDQLSEHESWTLEQVARLGQVRACLPSLRRGAWTSLLADDDAMAFLRHAGDGAPALTLINRSDGPIERTVPIPAAAIGGESGDFIDVLGGQGVRVRHGATERLTIPAHSAMVLVPADSGCAAAP